MDELITGRLERAAIEFTTGCNIRCVYCQSNRRDYVRQDLDLARFGGIVEFLAAMGARRVSAFGHGETTSAPGWRRCCDELLDAGIELDITTNLAKRFDEAETRTLSRFAEVTVSADTADPALFRRLRPGADLGRILETMAAIRRAALAEGRRPPRLGWNCVVSDVVAPDLEALVRLGLKAGVERFGFVNLGAYDIPDRGLPLRPLYWLPPQELLRAFTGLSRAVDMAQRAGAVTHVMPRLVELVERRIEEMNGSAAPVNRLGNAEPGPGQTRYCLDPWANAHLKASGAVWACCRELDLGVEGRDGSLAEILNGPKFQTLRKELLTGNLNPVCRTCPDKQISTLAELRQALEAYHEQPAEVC